MNSSGQNQWNESSGSDSPDAAEFEATLRLIAHLPLPEGLEDRLRVTLRAAEHSTPPDRRRILSWPQAPRQLNAWMRSSLGRSAAAAAIVLVVLGGGWGIYSRVQPQQAARTVAPPPRMAAPGGFSSAGAMRTPKTLDGPKAAHPAVATPKPAKAAGAALVRSKRAPGQRAKTAEAENKVASHAAPTAR